MVKCILVMDASIEEDLVELPSWTVKSGETFAFGCELENVDVEIRENVMVIRHEDGHYVLIKQ